MHLTGVLQLADPVGLFLLKAGHLNLNLNSFFVFLVDASDQVEALLLPLKCLLLMAQLLLLLFLAADHVFHRLSLQLVRLLLHRDHFLVLQAFLL